MASVNAEIEDLLLWANQLGTSLHSAVRIYEDPITGLSFKAAEVIPKETKLVSCSYRSTLSYLNAVNAIGFSRHPSEAFPRTFLDTLEPEDPNVIGHFFLVQQYLLGQKSFWWPYIRLLPRPDRPSSIPALWPEKDRKYLDGTNAEPAIKKRIRLWKEEWSKAKDLLQGFQNSDLYTFGLYQWAASIFGSRSFRPSLTIPESCAPEHYNHVKKDKFSILLPVMDIGNHNGINDVKWVIDSSSKSFILSNSSALRKNEQIFNYYGDKSNSELLVGYGFTLPPTSSLDRDVVNVQLKPGANAILLRQSQYCHAVPHGAGEEFMFSIQRRVVRDDNRLADFAPFSDGLIDLIICMVANKRESRHILCQPEYCPERDPHIFVASLGRACSKALLVLEAKLELEHERISASMASHPKAESSSQLLACTYAKSQLETIVHARSSIVPRLEAAISFSTFGQMSTTPGVFGKMHDNVELLSLERAFQWLSVNYPAIHDSVTRVISVDQEEPLPLSWEVLVDDWDHTYWIVWLYIVWVLWARDGEAFRLRHYQLSSWLADMNCEYDDEIQDSGIEALYADTSEQPTLDLMIEFINNLEQFSGSALQLWLQSEDAMSVTTRIRNFSSYVAHEETFQVDYPTHVNSANEFDHAGCRRVSQNVLCITKEGSDRAQSARGSWTACMNQSPGFRSSPTPVEKPSSD